MVSELWAWVRGLKEKVYRMRKSSVRTECLEIPQFRGLAAEEELAKK